MQNKLQALARKFFSKLILADILNINLSKYLESFETNKEIQEKEIYEAIQHTVNNKVPGPNQIPNRIFKLIEK